MDGKSEIEISLHRVKINVSGRIFEMNESRLLEYPLSLLGNIDKRKVFYINSRREYYFDRNAETFEGKEKFVNVMA